MRFKFIFIIFITVITNAAISAPWMTGPLLAPSGKTLPAGHINFEPYGFYTVYPAGFRNIETVPVLTAGINNFLDFQFSLPIDYSWNSGRHGGGIGDFSLGVGIQLLTQKDDSWVPDIRLVLQELFPSGRFEDLDPDKLGTDQTGIGALQTFVGLNFQKLSHVYQEHYLRTRLSLTTAIPSEVQVHGVNVFGGAASTSGKVSTEASYLVDLAFEYSLTQNWVPVFELLYVRSSSSDFDGNPGFTPGGTIAGIGGTKSNQLSFAPAIEYNFSPNVGMIVGYWFIVTGPRGADFKSAVIAINFFI